MSLFGINKWNAIKWILPKKNYIANQIQKIIARVSHYSFILCMVAGKKTSIHRNENWIFIYWRVFHNSLGVLPTVFQLKVSLTVIETCYVFIAIRWLLMSDPHFSTKIHHYHNHIAINRHGNKMFWVSNDLISSYHSRYHLICHAIHTKHSFYFVNNPTNK